MSISSASTISEIFAAYEDALDYDLVNDPAKARTVVQAARILIARMPAQSAKASESITYNIAQIEKSAADAKDWLHRYYPESLPTRSMSRFLSMEDFPA